MLSEFFNQTFPMIEETKKAKNKPKIFKLLIFFVLTMIGCSILGFFISTIYIALKASMSGLPQETVLAESFNMLTLLSADELNILNLVITGVTLGGFLLLGRFYEKRYFPSMGFTRKNIVPQYMIGLGLGLIMFGMVVLISILTGAYSFQSMSFSTLPVILITFVGFMIQGASEEVMLRGFLMTTVSARTNVLFGVIVNVVIFALLHLGNPNIGPISFINIILFGLFMSLYVLKTNNLWGACALHTMWNFAQGALFGISVSGGDVASSIFHLSTNKNMSLLNGGAFGAEGGIIATVILVIALFALYKWIGKDLKKKQS